jgi:hypothetical protein
MEVKPMKSRDAQTLMRMIYAAEYGGRYRNSHTGLTFAQKHEAQRRYEINRTRDGFFIAIRKST